MRSGGRRRMSLVRKFATVGSATLGSRILGFARETLMAAALGTGPVADAFYAAFRFPNLFRRLFAEGAFNAAFVPLFAKEIEAGGERGRASASPRKCSASCLPCCSLLTIVMELAMPLLVRTIIAPGFDDDADKFDMTVRLAVDDVSLPDVHVADGDDERHPQFAAPLFRRRDRAGLPQHRADRRPRLRAC